jgi:hypothetical protein
LWLGAASTAISASTAFAFASGAEALLGEHGLALHWTRRVPLSELGSELALAFVSSQLFGAALLAALSARLFAWLEQRQLASERRAPQPRAELGGPEALLESVLALQQTALDHVAVLAQTGARSFGQRAEHALADARRQLGSLLGDGLRALSASASAGEASLGAAGFSFFQLQLSLEFLLAQAERVTDAQLSDSARLAWDDDLVLHELHRLVSEGLAATRSSLTVGEPPNLDSARAREIKINRLEADARSVLLEGDPTPQLVRLRVIDAYEVVGNQVYRLAESVGHGLHLQSLA